MGANWAADPKQKMADGKWQMAKEPETDGTNVLSEGRGITFLIFGLRGIAGMDGMGERD